MAKIIANCIYVHRSNLGDLLSRVDKDTKNDILFAQYEADEWYMLKQSFRYEVIKFNKKTRCLTFIASPDWNEANEPEVGDGWMINLDTWSWKFIPKRKNNPQIYHSKELFVPSYYELFDVEKAKARTEKWKSLPNLDTRRIGNKNYWIAFLKENGMEV